MHNTTVFITELHPFGTGIRIAAIGMDLCLWILLAFCHHGLLLEVVCLRECGVSKEVVQVLGSGPHMIKLSLQTSAQHLH